LILILIKFIYCWPSNCLNDKDSSKNIKRIEKFSKLKGVLAAAEADAEKFYNAGNSATGTRVRKGMLELKNIAQESAMK